jgi:hypothetical protein
MKRLTFLLILLFVTVPCIAQAQEAGLNPVKAASDSNESDCISDTASEYDDWIDWDKPCCWCYAYQCRGDMNGKSFLGKPVSLADLDDFKAAFNQPDDVLKQNPELICSDFNHDAFLGKRVTLSDLNIFKLYFNRADIPQCDQEPIYTGPYNFFVTSCD